MSRSTEWTIARASSESLRDSATWRFRKSISTKDRIALPIEVSLIWRFSAPSSELQHRMEEFEEQLLPLVDAADSMLAVVATHSTAREWVFYASSYSGFEKSLNRAIRAEPRYPFEVAWSDDPAWQVYEELVSPVLGKAGS